VNEPGHFAGIVGPILILVGVTLIIASLIMTIQRVGNNRSISLAPWSPLSRRLRESVRRQTPVSSAELPALRAAAQVWVGQRWQLLFCLGASIAQFGANISSLGPRRYRFTIALTTFMAVSAVLIERRARIGTAFLANHPAPGPPEYLGGPQPGSV
jgi:hypothetical protein